MNPITSRFENLKQLEHGEFDVLVIGGGIVGSGVARDAALRGLRTALVDRHDFAFGTSSRSSRLLHGGLRYLEQGRIGLVREASLEKRVLRDIAPHLGDPLGFVFPAYRPEGRPLWQLRIGVKLYDLLCSFRNFGASRGYSAAEIRQLIPGLNPVGLRGAVRYFDALTNDARLVLDTLRSANAAGALVSNYTRFISTQRKADFWVVRIRDERDGREFETRARTIVNATGPWAQGLAHSGVALRLSKGIHIVVDRARLPITDAVVITEGKRILFVIPWGERLIIGTTDTDYRGDPESVETDPEDIAYVLKALNSAFPTLHLQEDEIISTWAGLRPLIANPDGSPSDISRAHQILSPEPAWWDVAGGKLTTYRLMAEQTVDKLLEFLRRPATRCRTAREPILAAGDTRFSGILPAPFSSESVSHFVNQEWALTLTDVMVRRSGWHYYHPDAAIRARQVAQWMSEVAGWSAERTTSELADYHRLVRNRPQKTAAPER
ncbi:MAG: glycerol-3-phosphate dehydrogenase/oxidase [Opitutaceae bacterium]|nr:glycerol-3-phosphate dehydrogenase/oxidase [Opitutaceae bacterium]